MRDGFFNTATLYKPLVDKHEHSYPVPRFKSKVAESADESLPPVFKNYGLIVNSGLFFNRSTSNSYDYFD